jgi:hypothetical protein
VPERAVKLGQFVIGDFAEVRGFWGFWGFIYGCTRLAECELKMRITISLRELAHPATNRVLRAAIANGTFREGLFYRLNVFPIQMTIL